MRNGHGSGQSVGPAPCAFGLGVSVSQADAGAPLGKAAAKGGRYTHHTYRDTNKAVTIRIVPQCSAGGKLIVNCSPKSSTVTARNCINM